MNKFLFLSMFILAFTHVKGQYEPFPKLEALYNETRYEKCLEKAETEIKDNPKEIMPYVWQMRCYLAIDELDNHPLKKNALSKALNTALKIKKKDKEGRLNDELNSDYQTISDKTVVQIIGLPEAQYANGIALFEKLKTLDNSLNLEYQKYRFMKEHYDAYAFMTLKNLVTKHYSLFHKKQEPLENMESAYADLIAEYFNLSYPQYARDIYIKGSEVYSNGKLCKETYLEHILNIANYTGYYTDEITLSNRLAVCLSADSLLKDPLIKTAIQQLRKYQAIINLRNPAIKNDEINSSILAYLNAYQGRQYDSANAFLDQLLTDNIKENLRLDKNKIYESWINVKADIRKHKQFFDVIKPIHQYYILSKKYEADMDFLAYCKTAYPSLKTALAPLKTELDNLIIAQISSEDYTDNPELIDKYSKKTDNKLIKEKQYKLYYTRLNALLTANNFSGFAVNIIRALALYPDDPAFLNLKKQWVINDYKANYLTTGYGYEQFFTKPPDESKCYEGLVNKKGQDIVLQKINYCRRLAGSPDSCVLDEELNKKCQKAALMMSANDALNHSPPKSWKCYTVEGASAAGASNLSLGHAFHHAIMGQMEDDGAGNTSCGHRRWLLNPNNTVYGHGSSMNATSIYAFGTSNAKLKRKLSFNDKQPICWPSTDYFPSDLIPKRWSFSLNGVDFEKAKVTVTEGGKSLPVSLEILAYGYGPNTIVWIINSDISVNKTYTVTVSNVMPYTAWGDTKPTGKTFTYRVIPFDIK